MRLFRHKITAILVLIITGVTALGGYRYKSRISKEIWFDNLLSVQSLTNSVDDKFIESLSKNLVRGKWGMPKLPGILNGDHAPRILFVTPIESDGKGSSIPGRGMGFKAALQSALKRGKDILGGRKLKGVVLDIVKNVQAAAKFSPGSMLNMEPGITGIAFGRLGAVAFLPMEITSNRLVDKNGKFDLKKATGLLKRRVKSRTLLNGKSAFKGRIYYFTTTGFFSDGKQTFRLIRGHKIFTELDKDELLEKANLAGEYLTRAVGESGRFDYLYRADRDESSGQYNILRHAGTIYSMLSLYEKTGRKEVLSASERALGYLAKALRLCREDGREFLCVVENDAIKLGGNALAVLAFSEYRRITGNTLYVPKVNKLAGWIKAVQNEDGSFKFHKRYYSSGKRSDFISEYYPGEAIYGLISLYEQNLDKSLLDAAYRAAMYLITVRDREKNISQLIHDHWLLYGLRRLYRHRKDPALLEHAWRICRSILKSQITVGLYPDWSGGYYTPPRSTPAATRSEGLAEAYHLFKDFGDAEQTAAILEGLKRGILFQLQLQLNVENAAYLKNPGRALGGFRSGMSDFDIRIDYVQHNLSSFLQTVDILKQLSRK